MPISLDYHTTGLNNTWTSLTVSSGHARNLYLPNMTALGLTTYLWFDNQALEATRF